MDQSQYNTLNPDRQDEMQDVSEPVENGLSGQLDENGPSCSIRPNSSGELTIRFSLLESNPIPSDPEQSASKSVCESLISLESALSTDQTASDSESETEQVQNIQEDFFLTADSEEEDPQFSSRSSENCSEESSDELAFEGLLEGLLFAAGDEGLSLLQLQSVLQTRTRQEIEDGLRQLQQKYAGSGSGMELACYASRYKLITKEAIYPYAAKLYAEIKAPALSSAALEVLALVAYRQPITRVEIEEIRGVSSDMMLKKLQARGLVETCGRKEAAGKPLLYRVTDGFLDAFGLESLGDLPEVLEPQVQASLFSKTESEESS